MRRGFIIALVLAPVAVVIACGEEALIPGARPDADASQEASGEVVDGAIDGAIADASLEAEAATDAGVDAFVRDDHEVLFMSRVHPWKCYKARTDGGDPLELVGDFGIECAQARWIEGYRRIGYSVFLGAGGDEIWSTLPDGGDVRKIAQGRAPFWDETHGRVVFQREHDGGARHEFLSVLPDGGDERTIVPPSPAISVGPISPDGKWILAVSNTVGVGVLLTENKPDGGSTALGVDKCRSPDWHPDGKKIVCDRSFTIADNRIIVVTVPDGVVTEITHGVAFDFEPVWSPDGKKILFVRGPGPGSAGAELYVMDADGTNIVKITSLSAQGPSWR